MAAAHTAKSMLKRKKLVNQALLIKFIENFINKTLLKISTANKKSRQYAKIHKAGLIGLIPL